MSSWRIVLGASLVALGTLLLLDQAGYAPASDILGRAWPLVIVALGVSQLLTTPNAPLGPALLIAVGLALLSTTLGLVAVSFWAALWPLLLVAIGIWLLFVRAGGHRPIGSREDVLDAFVAFGCLELVNRSRQFRGGAVNVAFGSIALDLREAKLAPTGATLSATSIFGGTSLRVPRGWRVVARCTPVFGGCEDRTEPLSGLSEHVPMLSIDALVIFGGLEIKH